MYTNLCAAGPPVPPLYIMLSMSGNTVTVSWAKSKGAQSYVVNMKCGTNPVPIDLFTNNTSVQFDYDPIFRKHKNCQTSVYALNPAGNSSVATRTDVLVKGKKIYIYNNYKVLTVVRTIIMLLIYLFSRCRSIYKCI